MRIYLHTNDDDDNNDDDNDDNRYDHNNYTIKRANRRIFFSSLNAIWKIFDVCLNVLACRIKRGEKG